MDELNFIYFSSLIQYSTTNYFVIIIIKIFEFYPIFIEFMCIPIRIKNYFNQTNIQYKSSIDNFKILKNIYKYSLYSLFREIKGNRNNYSICFLLLSICLVILFLFFVFFLKKKNDIFEKTKDNDFSDFIYKFIINFYDHFFFRSLSFFF